MGDLPDINNFFNEEITVKKNNKNSKKKKLLKGENILIYISKEKNKWISAQFIGIAVGHIGLHVLLPMQLELNTEELKNVLIKFVRQEGEFEDTIKELPVLVRWQENDNITGNLKLGLHFHGEIKEDPELKKILEDLKSKDFMIE